MTTTGENRDRYAAVMRGTDPRPSRFSEGGETYAAWAARADAWADPLAEGDRERVAAATAASPRYAAARVVVDTATAGTLEGALLDTFTASAMVAVYETLTPTNRAKFDSLPLDKLMAIVWKVTK